MSEVYVLEPPTHGKVILYTTHGPLDIELWSKECPKACMNFVQLCLDGYYDNTIFHRIIPNFIIQGGDPTGTGMGGESIYEGQTFPTEIHPRLMYRYRGLVGLATLNPENEENASRDPDIQYQRKYGSQFFITLSRADHLNQKNTLFGKVTGNSLYNLLSLAETPINPKTYYPNDPPGINYIEIIYSPFENLNPREGSKTMLKLQQEEELKALAQTKTKIAFQKPAIQNKNLLSFYLEENEETPFSSNAAVTRVSNETVSTNQQDSEKVKELTCKATEKKSIQLNSEELLKKRVVKHLTASSTDCSNLPQEDQTEEFSDTQNLSQNICEESPVAKKKSSKARTIDTLREANKQEAQQLRAELLTFKKGFGTVNYQTHEVNSVQDADLLTDYEKRRKLYVTRQRYLKKQDKVTNTLSKLQDFQKRLRYASAQQHEFKQETTSESKASNSEREDSNVDDETLSKEWFLNGLKFSVDSARAYELDAAHNALAIFDPLATRPKEEVNEKMRQLQNLRMKPSLKTPGKNL